MQGSPVTRLARPQQFLLPVFRPEAPRFWAHAVSQVPVLPDPRPGLPDRPVYMVYRDHWYVYRDLELEIIRHDVERDREGPCGCWVQEGPVAQEGDSLAVDLDYAWHAAYYDEA